MKLDEIVLSDTELNMLRVLQDQPDQPRKQIAKDAGVSEVALSKFVKKLGELGAIHRMNVIVLNPLKFGFDVLAFFRVTCEYKSMTSVIQTVALMPEVQEVHQSFSTMVTLILKVRSRDNTELSLLKDNVFSLEGVSEVTVDIVLSKKEETDLPI